VLKENKRVSLLINFLKQKKILLDEDVEMLEQFEIFPKPLEIK